MDEYIGTKVIQARRQDREGYVGEAAEGYAVRYPDGYESWSPKAAFEAAYRVTEGDEQALTFGDALHFLKAGRRVARKGWNGKGLWLVLAGFGNFGLSLRDRYSEELLDPFIVMKTAGDTFVPWLASQTDMLAADWCVLED